MLVERVLEVPQRAVQRMPAGWIEQLIEDGEAHVWHVRLDALRDAGEPLRSCLSAEETERARRIAAPLQRERFLTVRAAVRDILARYTGTSAAAIALAREPGGKPVITGTGAPHFSITHSAGAAAVAVSAAPVGIDVEHVRDLRRARAATRILHPETIAHIRALPQAEQAEAIIDAWTQREAHVKAVGGGMFRTPDSLPFDVAQRDAVQSLPGRDGHRWSVLRWSPAPNLRAALVILGPVLGVRHLYWNSEREG